MKTTNEFLRELACVNFDVDVQTKVALHLDERDRAARDQVEALRTSYVTLECQYARLMDQYMELKGQIAKLEGLMIQCPIHGIQKYPCLTCLQTKNPSCGGAS